METEPRYVPVRALLLNAGYEPIRILSWQRAFLLIFQEKVEILEEYQQWVRTINTAYRAPAVLRLRRWVNLSKPVPTIRFSRANLYARDGYRCQYCYVQYSERHLTLDHVHPVARGGKKTWRNIVTACLKCNQKKGSKTPTEAGLRLLRTPKAPKWLPGIVGTVKTKSAPDLWRPYLSSTYGNFPPPERRN